MKGVIVAAGYGTRLLPFTKTVPKELIPLVDRPAISFVVEEFVKAGIDDILIIGSRRKKALEDFFDREMELERVFHEEHRTQMLESIKPFPVQVSFVRQQAMRGTGHALSLARSFAAGEPIIVAYPDDLFMGQTINPSEQLIACHRTTKASVLAVQDMGSADVSRYGVVQPSDLGPPIWVQRLVEKPSPGQEPSKLISLGRYLLTADIFPLLEQGLKVHADGEFYHIGALNELGRRGQLAAVSVVQERLDVGDKLGYVDAFCRYALSRPELRDGVKAILKRLLAE